MAKRIALAGLLCLLGTSTFAIIDDERIFFRGDANMDGSVNASDAVCINAYLFLGGEEPGCLNQADANNDGVVNGSDPVYILNWLFLGGPALPDPGSGGTQCEQEDAPYPGCEENPCP